MTAAVPPPSAAEPPRAVVPSSVRWLLPSLTLLLAALAVYQLVVFAPRCLWVLDHFEAPQRENLAQLVGIPVWASMATALALAGVAFWQRGSVGRSALLATVALAVNVGLLIVILDSLSRMVRALSSVGPT